MIPKPRARLIVLSALPLAVGALGTAVPYLLGLQPFRHVGTAAYLALGCVALAAVVDAVVSSRGSPPRVLLGRSDGLALGKRATVEFLLEPGAARGRRITLSPDEGPWLAWLAPSLTVTAGSRDADEPTVVSFAGTASRRGPFSVGTVRVSWPSRLGLFAMVEDASVDGRLVVLPALEGLERARSRSRRGVNRENGMRKTRSFGEDGETEGLREYEPGEDARRIDWKSSARTEETLVRVRHSSSRSRVVFAIDSGRLMAAEREGRSALDHALAAFLAAGDTALRAGDSVSACAFAGGIVSELGEVASNSSLARLARFSSELEVSNVESDFVQLSGWLRRRLGKRSLVVVVTEASDTMPIEAMERAARAVSSRHALVIAFLRDRTLEEAAADRSDGEVAGFRAAAAAELLELRDEAVSRLRRHATVIVARASDLPDAVVNAYLEAKAHNRA